MSFALQYQFEAASWLSATAGISYTTFSGALLRNETITATGYAMQGGLVTVKGREAMRSLLNPQQWALRTGVLCHPHLGLNGRLQIGLNIIVPVSTLAPHVEKRRNWVNGQLYLRFLIK